MGHRRVVAITTAQFHSVEPELRFSFTCNVQACPCQLLYFISAKVRDRREYSRTSVVCSYSAIIGQYSQSSSYISVDGRSLDQVITKANNQGLVQTNLGRPNFNLK